MSAVGTTPLERVALALAPTVAAEPRLRVEEVDGVAAFAALREEWTELLEDSASNSLFLTWEWLYTWWTQLSGDRELELLALRRGDQLVGLAPFAARGHNVFGVPRLEFLGGGQVGSDYLDVIVRRGAEEDVVSSLAHHLSRTGALLDLRQARLTSSSASALARGLGAFGCRLSARRTHRCPFIEFAGRSWDEYLRDLGSQHRQDFRRKLKKLETLHDVQLERVCTETRRQELLPVLFELHRQRWSERGGSDGLEGPRLREFHDELTRLALERGWLRLFFLWVDGQPAATFYGFRYGRVFSFYQSGFDPRFAKLSVGLVSMGLAIKSAIEEGAEEFDLLHGEEAYKSHWARQTRRLGRVLVFPRGARGRLTQGAAAAREALRRVVRRGAWRGSARNGGRHAATAR